MLVTLPQHATILTNYGANLWMKKIERSRQDRKIPCKLKTQVAGLMLVALLQQAKIIIYNITVGKVSSKRTDQCR
jgi:hypothetical protein